jgi:hypothetical protein
MIQTMRGTPRLCLALSTAVLLSAASVAAQTPGWKTYTYPADGFSASYPSEPGFQKKNVPTDAGTFELRAYLAEDGQSALFVGVCDYGSAAAGRDPGTLLQGAKNGAVSNVSGRLVSEKRMTLGTYPGVEFEAENDSFHFSARVYLVGTTLFQSLVAYPIGKQYDGAARFLDSFQLIPRVQN